MSFIGTKKLALRLTAAVAGIALVVIVGLNAHGGDEAKIHACVDTRSGALRIIAPNGACRNNEAPLDWNIAGPQGAQGLPGPQGTEGVQGAEGAQGPAGAGGGLRVLDVNQEELGTYSYGPNGHRAVRLIDGHAVGIDFADNGFPFVSDQVTFYFFTSDCTGTAWVPYDGLVTPGQFVFMDPDPPRLYYADAYGANGPAFSRQVYVPRKDITLNCVAGTYPGAFGLPLHATLPELSGGYRVSQ